MLIVMSLFNLQYTEVVFHGKFTSISNVDKVAPTKQSTQLHHAFKCHSNVLFRSKANMINTLISKPLPA